MKHQIILAICFLVLSCEVEKEPQSPQVEVEISFGNEVERHAGQQIQLIAKANNAKEFVWNLGDGTIIKDSVVSHTYAEKGFYNVSVTASNVASSSDYETTIEVKDSIKTLLTGGGIQKWKLHSVVPNSTSGCYCNELLTFTSDYQLTQEFLTGELLCNSNSSDPCSTEIIKNIKFEVYQDENFYGNAIMIGPGASMTGYDVEVDENSLTLLSAVDGTIYYYVKE